MKKLAILGLGHIGKYVLNQLQTTPFITAHGYDLSTGHDLSDSKVLETIIPEYNGVLVSTPFHLNKSIAAMCNRYDVDYFDLTESVEVTNFVKSLSGNNLYITQCGLAPGMVSIIAAHMAAWLSEVHDIQIRVGALSANANNHLQYYRTWSTEGLINEYIHPCPALVNGELTNLLPLQDQELVTLGGIQLEAANTSGGIGSLAESFVGRARNVNYKTLRYPGHWDHIRFLADDLGLKDNFETYVGLFNRHVPVCTEDRVYILINVRGLDSNKKYVVNQYANVIESTKYNTAIQISTGSGVLCVIDAWAQGHLLNMNGWIAQEQLPVNAIFTSRYIEPYKIG